MRKTLALASIACLVLLAGPVRADDEGSARVGKDLYLTIGYKMWLNSWETAIPSYTNGGNHINSIVAPARLASIPNLSIKYKKLLISSSYMATGDYKFPGFKDTYRVGATGFTDGSDQMFTASRHEADVNLGWFFTPNLIGTIGYKNVEQKYTEKLGATTYPTSKTHYNGATIGVAGSAGIGAGFSMYGNAVGGLMKNSYTPSSSIQTAFYEASEVGFAWRGGGFSTSLGYKFQYLTTRGELPSADVARGYILGLSYTF